VSFSTVSLIAIVPESERSTPTFTVFASAVASSERPARLAASASASVLLTNVPLFICVPFVWLTDFPP
jgi:hypothetical protein